MASHSIHTRFAKAGPSQLFLFPRTSLEVSDSPNLWSPLRSLPLILRGFRDRDVCFFFTVDVSGRAAGTGCGADAPEGAPSKKAARAARFDTRISDGDPDPNRQKRELGLGRIKEERDSIDLSEAMKNRRSQFYNADQSRRTANERNTRKHKEDDEYVSSVAFTT